MLEGRKFYIQHDTYVVLTIKEKAITRRLYDDNKEKRTGKIRLNNKMEIINY